MALLGRGTPLGLALALVAGCSEDPVAIESAPSQLVRVNWEAGERSEVAVQRQQNRPPAGDEQPGWEVIGAGTTKVALPPFGLSDKPALWMAGPEKIVAVVPGPIPATVTGIEIEMFVRHRINVQVSLVRNESEDHTPYAEVLPGLLKAGSMTTETLQFRRLPSNADEAPFDELRITAEGGGGQVILLSVTWEQGSPEGGLPLPGDEPALAFLGKDGRQAVAVTSQSPARASWEAMPDHVLAFDAGVPVEMYPKGLQPKLQVQLTGADGESQSRTIPIVRGGWKTIWLPLDQWSSGEVQLEVRMTATRPAVGLLGDVRIVPAPNKNKGKRSPVILLISSDTHRADHLGVTSDDPRIQTPALDKLSTRGVRFQDAWSSSNVTLPSHSALLTGVHPKDTGVINNATSLGSSAATLAERFADAGYGTFGVISSRHLSETISGFGQGFDRYSETNRTTITADVSTGRLLRWIEQDWGRPIFAFLHLFDAHAPYEPPAEFAEGTEGMPDKPRNIALYAGEVSFVDSQLAALLDHPRVKGGITAFTADHGESLGAHKIKFSHAELYPDTTHVPLLLAWQDAPAGLVVPGEVRQMDIGRTLLDLAGLAAKDFPGRSLLHWVEAAEEGAAAPNVPTFALASGGQSAAIRDKGWQLTLHLIEHQPVGNEKSYTYPRHFVELYHLAEDPGATKNLVHKRKDHAKLMRQQLVDWLMRPAEGFVAEAASLGSDDMAALAQMGYAGGDLDGSVRITGLFPESCDCKYCSKFE